MVYLFAYIYNDIYSRGAVYSVGNVKLHVTGSVYNFSFVKWDSSISINNSHTSHFVVKLLNGQIISIVDRLQMAT